MRKIRGSHAELRVILKPAFKVLPQLGTLFTTARLVGWKIEMDGNREMAILKAKEQLANCQTTLCIINGKAFGEGFGVVDHTGLIDELPNRSEISRWLCEWAKRGLTVAG